MRSLAELLGAADGRSFLESRGVWIGEASFVSKLSAPARGELAQLAELDAGKLPVYMCHQLQADYRPSVTAKVRAAGALGRRYPGVAPVLLWLDVDRAGADKSTASVQLSGRGGTLKIRLASRRHDQKEIRFVPLDRPALEEALRRMRGWARQQGRDVFERLTRLEHAVLSEHPTTLGELNLATTAFLTRERLGVDAPSILISDLLARGPITDGINEVVDRIDDVIAVFNAAVDGLIAADVDPQVRYLDPDYLPLHYSCERDDRRCSLIHERRGPDHFAVTTCSCGATYRFHLGSTRLSITELAGTGRWSMDVTLLIYLADLASGVVAGRSSALYGLVLNEVAEKVLGRRPVPMLVPEELGSATLRENGADATTSPMAADLVALYLLGG